MSAVGTAPATVPAGFAYSTPRKRQSIKAHLWLALLTGGMGNIVYAWYVGHHNKRNVRLSVEAARRAAQY